MTDRVLLKSQILGALLNFDPGTYLPARGLLVAIISVIRCDVRIDAVEIQLVICGTQDGLGDHLCVAVLWFDRLVLLEAQVHIVGT